ncbi:serine hydrolase [Sphingomonas daechungensis]|uniref:serine hydrolase n=1 Tax=Sphingomonas daechungensis TaxID=1176646 RepID=UPI001CB8C6DA|nr:serine hydrolase [Sphingomonas daechungensis]
MRILARLFAILVLAPVLSPASAPATTPGRAAAIDRVVEAELGKAKANGLAVAIVEHGQVVRVRCYGTRNVRGDPLTPQSIMYGASLTKAVFAYTVMRLADEGKVAQDEPIAAMLSKPLPDYGNLDKYGNWGDLAGDSRWRKLTPASCSLTPAASPIFRSWSLTRS